MTNPPQSTPEGDLRARVERGLAPAYEIQSEIGRGGAGIVYRARDTRLKRDVAIKLLPPDLAFRSDVRERFMREAETSARLNHPRPEYAGLIGHEGTKARRKTKKRGELRKPSRSSPLIVFVFVASWCG